MDGLRMGAAAAKLGTDEGNRLVRPGSRYNGAARRPWTPVDER